MASGDIELLARHDMPVADPSLDDRAAADAAVSRPRRRRAGWTCRVVVAAFLCVAGCAAAALGAAAARRTSAPARDGGRRVLGKALGGLEGMLHLRQRGGAARDDREGRGERARDGPGLGKEERERKNKPRRTKQETARERGAAQVPVPEAQEALPSARSPLAALLLALCGLTFLLASLLVSSDRRRAPGPRHGETEIEPWEAETELVEFYDAAERGACGGERLLDGLFPEPPPDRLGDQEDGGGAAAEAADGDEDGRSEERGVPRDPERSHGPASEAPGGEAERTAGGTSPTEASSPSSILSSEDYDAEACRPERQDLPPDAPEPLRGGRRQDDRPGDITTSSSSASCLATRSPTVPTSSVSSLSSEGHEAEGRHNERQDHAPDASETAARTTAVVLAQEGPAASPRRRHVSFAAEVQVHHRPAGGETPAAARRRRSYERCLFLMLGAAAVAIVAFSVLPPGGEERLRPPTGRPTGDEEL